MTPPLTTVRRSWFYAVGLVLLAIGLSAFAWWPMLSAYPATETYEGPFMQQMLEAARVSVMRYHELPLWNAYQCGGIPLWDNPQGMGLSPLVWPLLLFTDTTRTLELWYVLHAAAGFVCMWIFTRRDLGLSREGAFVASGAWAFCGAHALHFTGTGYQWASSLYLPLSVFLWRRAEKDVRMAVGLGILVALQFWGAAFYPIMYTTVVLFGETLTRVWRPSRMRGIFRAALVSVPVAFFLSAGRLIPVIYQGLEHTRPIGVEVDAMLWSTVKDMFLARTHTRWVVGQSYVWPEYGNYFGPLLIGLFLAGVVLDGGAHLWLLFVFLWTLLFMLGHVGKWAPWHILKTHVYPFKDMRVPSRFTVSLGALMAAFAGIGVDKVSRLSFTIFRRHSVERAVRTAVFAIGLIGVGDMITTGYPWILDSYVGKPIVKNVPISARLFVEGPDMVEFVDQPRQNRGRIKCWDEWRRDQPDAPVWGGDVPQAKSTMKEAVVGVTRTQNTFTVDVDAKAPTRIVFNTVFDRGWRASVGQVVDGSPLLGVDVPAGQFQLRVKYWPRGLTVGLLMTFLGCLGVAAFFVRDWRRRTADASSARV